LNKLDTYAIVGHGITQTIGI